MFLTLQGNVLFFIGHRTDGQRQELFAMSASHAQLQFARRLGQGDADDGRALHVTADNRHLHVIQINAAVFRQVLGQRQDGDPAGDPDIAGQRGRRHRQGRQDHH
jgi:hypothetical protein